MIEGLYFFLFCALVLAIYFGSQMARAQIKYDIEKKQHADTIYNLELYRTKYNELKKHHEQSIKKWQRIAQDNFKPEGK